LNPARVEGRPRTPLYRFCQVIVTIVARLYFRHETLGNEHLPDKTGAVVATNHASVLDPPLIGVDLKRPLFIMAKQSLHDLPLFGSFIRAMHSFPVRRGAGDRGAIRKAVEVIQEGNLVLLFLEGTRSRDGTLQTPRPGIGKIVTDSNCPVIPGYVHGSFQALGPGQWIPRPVKTWTRFGKPLQFSSEKAESQSTREHYQQIADRVMEQIERLKSEDN